MSKINNEKIEKLFINLEEQYGGGDNFLKNQKFLKDLVNGQYDQLLYITEGYIERGGEYDLVVIQQGQTLNAMPVPILIDCLFHEGALYDFYEDSLNCDINIWDVIKKELKSAGISCNIKIIIKRKDYKSFLKFNDEEKEIPRIEEDGLFYLKKVGSLDIRDNGVCIVYTWDISKIS